jgi:hypothetical protein
MTETAAASPSLGIRTGRRILVVVSIAVAARLAAALVLGSAFYFADEGAYLDASQHLLADGGFRPEYTNVPGYPALLALLGAWTPGSLFAMRCVQALAAGSGGAMLIVLARRTFGAGAPLAGLLYALDPLLVVAGALLFPEALAAVVLMATLLAVWTAATTDRLLAAAFAGGLLALLVLCRPVAFVLLPVLALWTLAYAGAPLGRRAVLALTLAVCCCLALAPWALRNARIHGTVVPASTPGLQNAPVSKATIRGDGLVSSLLHQTQQRPLALVQRMFAELPHFWELYPTRLATDSPEEREKLQRGDPRLSLAPVVPAGPRDWASALAFGGEVALAVPGFVIGWRRHRAATVLFVAVMLTYSLGYSLFLAKLRYRITVVPCVLLFAGLGGAELGSALTRARAGHDAPR